MNPYITNAVPLWISFLFLIAFVAPPVMIASLAQKRTVNTAKKDTFFLIMLFFVIYFIYVIVGAFAGWFEEITLPPRIMQLTAIPLLFFFLLVVYNIKAYKRIRDNCKTSEIIKLHVFRVIGLFFVVLALYDVLPTTFGFIAGTADFLTSITCYPVAKALENKKVYAKRLALAWNTFGFIDILITAVMAFVITKASIETGAPGVEILAQFPFCFIPAFAPATIIFLHITIYRKLFKNNS